MEPSTESNNYSKPILIVTKKSKIASIFLPFISFHSFVSFSFLKTLRRLWSLITFFHHIRKLFWYIFKSYERFFIEVTYYLKTRVKTITSFSEAFSRVSYGKSEGFPNSYTSLDRRKDTRRQKSKQSFQTNSLQIYWHLIY